MLEAEGLVRMFGPFRAVDGISLTVRRGEVLGFLGPNGAGKSTTMKMVTGYLTPNAGRARICGYDVHRDTLKAQRHLGYLPEGAPAYGDMTPAGFLDFIAEVRGLAGAAKAAAIEMAVGRTDLAGVLEQPIETLSKGFRRRVGLAQAILHDPDVLIMDEPTDGLDPNQKHAVRRLIREMAPAKAIVISTHILEEVEAICTRAVIIDRGRIVADGTPAELLARSRHHNAVTLVVAPAQVEKARALAKGLEDVATVEEAAEGENLRLTLFPRDRAHRLIDQVTAETARVRWSPLALYAEPGRMDEVFRTLTSSESRAA